MQEISDREIIEKFKDPARREAAFSNLVEKYQEKLYWHCRRLVLTHENADDALQNTFIKIWKNLDHFRAESSLYTWLFRIATNESLSLLKSMKKHGQEGNQPFEERIAENLESDPYFDGDEIMLKLQKAIASLPEKQRAVFNLKYYEDLKYEEMSGILHTSVGALKASYHHAVKKIEKFLNND